MEVLLKKGGISTEAGIQDAMKIPCWNVQGLENPRMLQELRHEVRSIKPQVVFLVETKGKRVLEGKIKLAPKFGSISVTSKRNSGGLMLLWNGDCNIDINSFSNGHIDSTIKEKASWWRFTSFYGNPMTSKRAESWKLMDRLGSISDLPWLIGGDFNEILFADEKRGVERSQKQMDVFQDVVDKWKLYDLGNSGNKYT